MALNEEQVLEQQQLLVSSEEDSEEQGYTIVNPVSGEIVSQRNSLEEHIALLAEIEHDEQTIKDQKALLQAAIMQKMADNDQTLFEGQVYRAQIQSPSVSYSYTNDMFKLINEGLIRQDEWDALHKEEVNHKFNRTQLKKLMKKGGRIKEIISKSTLETPKGNPKLVYERLPEYVQEYASPDMEAKNQKQAEG